MGGAEERLKTPPSLYSKNDAPVQLVLCADTIGQVRNERYLIFHGASVGYFETFHLAAMLCCTCSHGPGREG